ncbi:GLPGLI family protein [Flavobacterium sp. MFBS3-15]|uniref:GLPGLI family protein n=1 Tax=Flavobacterium sp. MFBS3-15 TaxID=2989816 RepID=UPI0022364AA5|nr:GLPGLI family protein [Flavobacterium sp. MFBS3-15]MCW4468114.1 GLPGLI family protein [Flavobacterium sp. MFBS3-15]
MRVLLFLLLGFATYSQTITVAYRTDVMDLDKYGSVLIATNELVTNQSESLYFTRMIDTVVVTANTDYVQDTRGSKSRGAIMYKNLKEKYAFYPVETKNLLKDENYNTEWTVTNVTKTILGYKCQQATGSFRGRSYKVYFTSEIPYRNGPFKFDGLPGLILEVSSDDGTVHIIATQLKNTDETIEKPFGNLKFEEINWPDYRKKYKLLFDKITNYRPNAGEGVEASSSIPKRGIEYLIDD